MRFRVRDLVGNQRLMTVNLLDRVQDAIGTMLEHDYSQLPVLDSGRLVGMVTTASILDALRNLNATPAKLRVSDALMRITNVEKETFGLDDEPFSLLQRLRNTGAVAIVDAERAPVAIVTNADMAEWLRERAQYNMFVADIETSLKEFIKLAFQDRSGTLDRSALDEAASRVASRSARDEHTTFKSALRNYFSLQGDQRPEISESIVSQIIAKHYRAQVPAKTFDDLSLADYIVMFLDEGRWARYDTALPSERAMVRALLENVRKIRNNLSHSRRELTPDEKRQVVYCRDWLDQHEDAIRAALASSAPAIVADEGTITPLSARPSQPEPIAVAPSVADVPPSNVRSARVEQATTPPDVRVSREVLISAESRAAPEATQHTAPRRQRENRYNLLAQFLRDQDAQTGQLILQFSRIKDIIGAKLPPYARKIRTFWANDSVSHVQSQQWLQAGWKVESVDLQRERVTFARTSLQPQE
jgi:CBS domain-containing protein